MEYGKMISSLRKSHGMTQAELGNALNVTFQAVSKWERDESYPDFETLSKIAKIFGVPISYFEDGIIPSLNESAGASHGDEIIGICTVCGKAMHSADVAETKPSLICLDCKARSIEDKIKKQEEGEENKKRQASYEKSKAISVRNRGLIAGAIASAVIIAIMVAGLIITNEQDIAFAIGGTVFMAVIFYTFVSQLFWGGVIVDIALWGFKTFGMPGVIFTLDLDGLIFLIAVKILFAILKFLLLVLTILLGVIFAMIVSLFTFIPSLIKLSRGKELD